jgi:regulator of nonsense transcripts 2
MDCSPFIKEGEENKDTPHYRLMVLLEQEMPECHRREQIDEIAERFCTNHGSQKKARNRLLKTMFLVPRSRLDLLSYYSRMSATLDRVWGEIGPALVTELEQQFHGQTKFKKNQNIESRMRTARYIGELTKFRVAPPMVFLRCVKRCLEDFTGSNVDVACCLLESCGRFLYRLKHTSSRVSDLMDIMTRLSKAKVSPKLRERTSLMGALN